MTRPNRYPYTKDQLIFKELKSNNGKIVFDGRTFEFKTGHSEALNVYSGQMNARKLKGRYEE
nr:MAG TPA: general transcription factor [Caudoviricetes sp.]